MIGGNSNHNSKNTTLAAESLRQRQQHTYPTQKATNRDPTMAPSTPKASKHGGSTSTNGRITGPSTDNRRRPQYSTPKRGGGNPRIVHSPLIDAPPTHNPSAQDARLVNRNPRDRWKAMSELAGSHKQSLEVLDLSNRSLSAQALKFGVPRKTAQSVRDLRYDGNLVGDGDDGNNDLPAFLDIVVQLFPRLQHLSLRNNPCSPGNKRGGASPLRDAKLPTNIDPKLKSKLDAAIDAANREQMRMHRLYIIYRLPDLSSINGQPVSDEERQLARPLYPSGTPVRKEVWLTKAMAPLEVDVDVGVGSSSSSDGLKVAGKNHASNADPDDDTGSEMIVPSEAGGMAMSSVEVSMSGFVNYVRTETDAAPESDQKVPVDDGDQGKRKSSKGGGSTVEFAPSSKKTSRALPPPSPFSKQRTFPPPRQSRRSSKAKGGNNAAAKQLWRQRNKRNVNVGSMVDDESDAESSGDDIEEDEDDLMIPQSESDSDSRAKLTRLISNDDLESKSTASSSLANWGGTMGTSAQMD